MFEDAEFDAVEAIFTEDDLELLGALVETQVGPLDEQLRKNEPPQSPSACQGPSIETSSDGVSDEGRALKRARRPTEPGECLHAEHSEPCTRCNDPPGETEASLFVLAGEEGKKNGAKLLRARIARCRQWNDRELRKETAKLVVARGYSNLGSALEAGRSTDMRTEDMLILASVWGLRSTIWRRRNPPGDASVVRGSSGSGGSGSFPALGGHASPSLALERTGLVISTDPATLVLMLQRNTLPRAREMMDYNLSIMLETRTVVSALVEQHKDHFMSPVVGMMLRQGATQGGAASIAALASIATQSNYLRYRAEVAEPPFPGQLVPTVAEEVPTGDCCGIEAYFVKVHSGLSEARNAFFRSRSVRDPRTVGIAQAEWEDRFYVKNGARVLELHNFFLTALSLARKDNSTREQRVAYLKVVELAAECAIALEIRLDSSTLISADWAEAHSRKREAALLAGKHSPSKDGTAAAAGSSDALNSHLAQDAPSGATPQHASPMELAVLDAYVTALKEG